jgi:signal peptidase II
MAHATTIIFNMERLPNQARAVPAPVHEGINACRAFGFPASNPSVDLAASPRQLSARTHIKTPSMPAPLRNALPIAIAAALAIVALGQLTKYLVVVAMNLRETGEIAVFPGLTFRMAWNTGVNFGILSGDPGFTRWLLAAFSTMIAAVLVFAARNSRRLLTVLGLGIAAGGALGNVIDRFTWGAVADFLNVTCCGVRNPWSFNVADIAIFVGFGLLLLPGRRVSPGLADPSS